MADSVGRCRLRLQEHRQDLHGAGPVRTKGTSDGPTLEKTGETALMSGEEAARKEGNRGTVATGGSQGSTEHK